MEAVSRRLVARKIAAASAAASKPGSCHTSPHGGKYCGRGSTCGIYIRLLWGLHAAGGSVAPARMQQKYNRRLQSLLGISTAGLVWLF